MAASEADSGGLSRKELAGLAVLVAAAAAWRWVEWLRTAAIFDDGPRFLAIARAFDAGAWSPALRDAFHPLYPLATVGAHRALALADSQAGWETAGTAVSVLASAAAVGFVFLFVREAFGRAPAWAAAVLLAGHAHAVEYGSDVQSDGLYMGLVAAGIWAGWRALRDRSSSAAAGAGLAAGLAYLTRPEGLGVALVVGGIGAFEMVRQRWSWKTGARWLAALGAAMLLCVAPYVVALHQLTGVWTLTHKKSVVGIVRGDVAPTPGAPVGVPAGPVAESPPVATPPPPPPWLHALHLTTPAAVDPSWLDPEYLDQDGLRVALATSRTERAFEALRMLGRHARSSLRYGIVVLVAFGLLAAWGRPTRRGVYIGAFAVLYLLVLYGLTFSSGYVSRRHTLPPLLPAFGYAGLGGIALGAWLARRARAPRSAGVLGALVIGAFAAGDLWTQRAPKRFEESAMRSAAEWLREHAPEPGPVAAPRQRFGYYAGMPYVPLAGVADDALARYLSGTQARYVLLDDVDQLTALRRAQALGGSGPLGDAEVGGAEGIGVRLLHQVEVAGVQAFVVELSPRAPVGPGGGSGTPAER